MWIDSKYLLIVIVILVTNNDITGNKAVELMQCLRDVDQAKCQFHKILCDAGSVPGLKFWGIFAYFLHI